MTDVFEHTSAAITRVVAVRAAAVVALHGLPPDFRWDLEQEGLLAVWQSRLAFDPGRGTWRPFAERVVANHLASVLRHMHSTRSSQFREEPLDNHPDVPGPNDCADLLLDVRAVLARVSLPDRRVALSLMYYSALETCQRLGVSRATVYRAIGRLRVAFTKSGLTNVRDCRRREVC